MLNPRYISSFSNPVYIISAWLVPGRESTCGQANHLVMQPATQVNSAWPPLCAQVQWIAEKAEVRLVLINFRYLSKKCIKRYYEMLQCAVKHALRWQPQNNHENSNEYITRRDLQYNTIRLCTYIAVTTGKWLEISHTTSLTSAHSQGSPLRF